MRPNYFDFDRYRWRGTYRPVNECSGCRAVVDLLRAGFGLCRTWARRVRERRELAGLDHRMLRDIGATPGDMTRECNKPFWRC
ncbi:MAG TPA: DUF1127 domain-containing protein [Stellaceae bacterium]|nr:DUF1127 domain-containing protein [Stellaceae bacterium]